MGDGDGLGVLTPWVPTLRARVDALVRELLGIPTGRAVDLLCDESGLQIRVPVGVGQAPLAVFDIRQRTGQATGWGVGERLAVSYRPDSVDALGPAGDRLVAALKRRLARRLRPAEHALADAIAALTEAREVDDWMYRQLTRSGDRLIGNLRLGFRCNQDCHFCWQRRSWPDPPTPLLFTWLDELVDAGAEQLIFTGGEPTNHPAFFDLLAHARDRGVAVDLQTNAIRCRRPDFARALADHGVAHVFVSLHSADPAISDAMTRARGTHGPTLRGVAECLRAGLHVTLNAVVERANVTGLEAHARDVIARFVAPFPENPVRCVTYSYPAEYADRELYRAALVPLDAAAPHLVAAAHALTDAGVAVELGGTCGFPPCALRGAPTLPEPLPAARVADDDLASRRYVAACARCAARAGCLGLRASYVEFFGEQGVVPFEVDPYAVGPGATP